MVDDDQRLRIELNELWFEVEVRDGHPECVAVRADIKGPPVTTSRLRIRVAEAVRELVEANTVRLNLDADGSVVGVLASSPLTPDDTSTDRTADIRRVMRTPKPGRPALSDELLREVAEIYEQAEVQAKPTGRALADHFHIEPRTARQWVHKARKRGFLNKGATT